MWSHCHGAKNSCSSQTFVILCVLYSRDQVCNYRLHKLKETLNKIHLHSIYLSLQLEKIVKKAIEWCIALRPSVTITWKAIHAGTLDSLTSGKKLDEYRR